MACLARTSQPALSIRRPACPHRSVLLGAAASQGGPTQNNDIKHITTDQVKAILKKEHENHGQGKVMFLHMEGRGRRMTVGHDETHVGNLSGLPYQSVDYSMFN